MTGGGGNTGVAADLPTLHNQQVMVPVSFHIPVAIILLGGGLLACFLGYRLLRMLLAVYGFVGGVIIAAMYVEQFEETWMAVLVTVGGGLTGSVLALVAYLAGVALLGAAFGAVALNVAWSYRGGEPVIWLVLVACFAGALVALALRRYVIIVGTSFGGAWTALVGGLALAGNSAAVAAAGGNVQQLYPLAPAGSQTSFVAGWFGLGALAVLVQLRGIGRRRLRAKAK